jgi:ubiquinone/menaquinone biosynthesis C-methylase UbiE
VSRQETNVKLLPTFIKRQTLARLKAVAYGRKGLYLPSHAGKNAYCIHRPDWPGTKQATNLPVPPQNLWVGYGPNAEAYLAIGKRHVANMARILEENDCALKGAKRILEFGCAAGRMIRHVQESAPDAELWGVDISAEHIRWCIDNLTPAIHFATNTIVPHLPFEDGFFDLIFSGSVFTHIEDIQEAWLLELGRVLRPNGHLYLTIHDEHTIRMLEDTHRTSRLAKMMDEQPIYSANKGDFGMIVVWRGSGSQVFYDSRYFRSIVPPFFRWQSHNPGAYEYQSAVLLEKLRTD